MQKKHGNKMSHSSYDLVVLPFYGWILLLLLRIYDGFFATQLFKLVLMHARCCDDTRAANEAVASQWQIMQSRHTSYFYACEKRFFLPLTIESCGFVGVLDGANANANVLVIIN